MASFQIKFFPYAFELTNLMVQGKQTNPLIKDFLNQFPISQSGGHDTFGRSGGGEYSDFAGIEAQLDEEEKIKQISENIENQRDEKTDQLYQEIKDYPMKRASTRDQEYSNALMEERRKKLEAEKNKKKQLEMRKKQLEPVTKDDFNQMQQEHNEKLKSLYKSHYMAEIQKQKQNQTPNEIAQERRDALVTFGKEATEMNKKVIPKQTLKAKKKAEATAAAAAEKAKLQEKTPPPFATDLSDFTQRMNAEMKELSALKDDLLSDSYPDLNTEYLFQLLTDPGLNGTDTKGPDYHMQFAMLFQKLENAEQKIKELEEKADNVLQ